MDPVLVPDTNQRGFKCMTAKLPKLVHYVRVMDINLAETDALLLESTFEFFALRVLFL